MLAAALLALLSLSSCVAAAGDVVRIEVSTGAGSQFTFEPAHIVSPAGAQLVLTLTNASSEPHNLVLVDPVGVATRSIVRAGQSDTVSFAAPPAGSYRFVCSIHPGMEGLLEVR